MFGFDTNSNAFGLQLALDPFSDSGSYPLLDLWATREHVDRPCELGETYDPLAGYIADRRSSDEGQGVMFANAYEAEMADYDEPVVPTGSLECSDREELRCKQLGVGPR